MKWSKKIFVVMLLAGACWGGNKYSIDKVYAGFYNALVGEDMYLGAKLGVGDGVKVEMSLYDKNGVEWNSVGGMVELYIDISNRFVWYLWGGGKYDEIDFSSTELNLSYGLSDTTYSRFVPTYGVGVEWHTIRQSEYSAMAKLIVGDFVPVSLKFGSLHSCSPETLSTLIGGEFTVFSPFGGIGLLRYYRLRDWFGDDVWRLWYKTPYYGIFRMKIGWENGFLGFGDIKVKIGEFSAIFGVRLPVDIPRQMWYVGIEYEPLPDEKGKRDIRVLAPSE